MFFTLFDDLHDPEVVKKWFVWPRSGEKYDIELKNITSSFSTILGHTNHWKESI